jgi:hypothetical protein
MHIASASFWNFKDAGLGVGTVVTEDLFAGSQLLPKEMDKMVLDTHVRYFTLF